MAPSTTKDRSLFAFCALIALSVLMTVKTKQPYPCPGTGATPVASVRHHKNKKEVHYTTIEEGSQIMVHAAPTDPAILIIENDEETRELYVDALSPVDAVLIETGNPYEAFEQLGKRSFSLILTDLHMPGGGIEFLANLRAAEVLCPIIVITGLGGDSVRNAAMEAGATVFLEKPIRTKQLREVVNRFLSSTPTIA